MECFFWRPMAPWSRQSRRPPRWSERILAPVSGANKRTHPRNRWSRPFMRGWRITGWSPISSRQCARPTKEFSAMLATRFLWKELAAVCPRLNFPIGSCSKFSIKTALRFLPMILSRIQAAVPRRLACWSRKSAKTKRDILRNTAASIHLVRSRIPVGWQSWNSRKRWLTNRFMICSSGWRCWQPGWSPLQQCSPGWAAGFINGRWNPRNGSNVK